MNSKSTKQNNSVRSSRGSMALGVVQIVLLGLVGAAVFLMVYNIGSLITIHQKAQLVAQNAAENLAKRSNWLGVEKGSASPENETMAFIRMSTQAQGLPQPTLDHFQVKRSGRGRLLFTVTYAYKMPIVGGIPILGDIVTVKSTGSYNRANDCAPIVLRIQRANGSSIFIPGFGLNGPNSVGKFLEPSRRFDGYFFWNTGEQQIESESKPAAIS
jgi:hypothetical protein